MTRMVVLTTRPDPIARLVQGALEAEDVPVRVERDGLAAVYGLHLGAHASRVLVPVDRLDLARSILADLDAG